MLNSLRVEADGDGCAISPVTNGRLDEALAAAPPAVAAWARATGYRATPGDPLLVAGPDGGLARVLVGVADPPGLWDLAGLPSTLPQGVYRLDAALPASAATRLALGWALGCYRYTRYRASDRPTPVLIWPAGAERAEVERAASAVTLVRDLVNTPARDLGPAELAGVARTLAGEFEAEIKVTVGAELVSRNYPAIHAVGAASPRPPHLIDLTWGRDIDPMVTLVGKGVCFDTGGLDLKPSAAMRLMKKDMAGAAHALGVARMIMMAGLPVRLRVLIPAVDNAVGGDALRPLDVIATRKGLTVEVGNTDAEGRLILADALAAADADRPAMIVDFATLTGAARAALGTEIPAAFTNDEALARELDDAAEAASDPVWRLPLWPGYRKDLESKVADLANDPGHRYGGAIIAALFLERFVSETTPWLHLDLMGWNLKARPGRPEGGEAMGLRAVYRLIAGRYDTAAAVPGRRS